jgi:DUF1365 family protein
MLLDIDRVEEAVATMRLFSYNRFNLLSFHTRDHGDGSDSALRKQVEATLTSQGITPPSGPVRLFCMPRVLGHGFNPLSVFFCYDPDERLRALVYEVHNTFGERYSYAFAVDDDGKVLRHGCEKDFYVSPFMDMELSYSFRMRPPSEKVAIGIETSDPEGVMLFAALSGEKREASDASLLRLAVAQPLVTLKVVVAIHVHAAILWWKGVGVRRWKPNMRRNRGAAIRSHSVDVMQPAPRG